MKYLILCPSDKRIIHISTSLEYNKIGGLILDTGLQIAPSICEVAEVDDVPSSIEVEKYCYIDNNYILNENYIVEENADEVNKDYTD
jgi:hypothetical protein